MSHELGRAFLFMEEIWKDIPDYEGLYQASNSGQIKSLKNNVILKQFDNKYGYLIISLYNKGIRKTYKVHKIIAIVFLNHKPDGLNLVINHKNLIKHDNRSINLEIITNRDNSNMLHIKSSSKYIGASFHKKSNKWEAKIMINKKQKYLGLFDSEIEASNAYQKVLSAINKK